MFSIRKAGERAQLIKGSLSRHEDLSVIPMMPPQKTVMIYPCNPSVGERDTDGCLGIAGQPVYLAYLVSSAPVSDLVSKKKKSRQCLRNDICAYMYTFTYTHINMNTYNLIQPQTSRKAMCLVQRISFLDHLRVWTV